MIHLHRPAATYNGEAMRGGNWRGFCRVAEKMATNCRMQAILKQMWDPPLQAEWERRFGEWKGSFTARGPADFTREG